MQFHDLILRPVIKGSTFMSVLDMASGFYQVGVRVMAFNEFQQYFSYIMAVSLISGGNWSTRRKPPACRKPIVRG
jgi:hypothetical protein